MRMGVGHERNGSEVISTAEYFAYKHGLLMDIALVWFNGESVNPERGIWHWSSLDANISNAREAGFRNIWLKWTGTPAHATVDGTITYRRYTAGPWSWSLDNRGNAVQPAAFDPSLPWVANPTRIMQEWVRDLHSRVIERYCHNPIARGQESSIAGLVSLNEPDDGSSFPPNAVLPLDKAWGWYFQDVLHPFRETVVPARSSLPNLAVLGPEATSTDGIRRVMDSEALDGLGSYFTHPTIHLYAGTLDEAKETLDARMGIIERHRGGRTVGITEGSDDQPWFWQLAEYIRDKYPDVITEWILYAAGGRQPCFTPASYADGTYQLSAFGERVREWNEEETRNEERRRAVRNRDEEARG